MVFSRLASRSLTPLTSFSLHRTFSTGTDSLSACEAENQPTSQRKSGFVFSSPAVLSRSCSARARQGMMSRAPCDRI